MFWVRDILDVIVFITVEALGLGVGKVPRSAQGQKSEFTIISQGRTETFLLFCDRKKKCGLCIL